MTDLETKIKNIEQEIKDKNEELSNARDSLSRICIITARYAASELPHKLAVDELLATRKVEKIQKDLSNLHKQLSILKQEEKSTVSFSNVEFTNQVDTLNAILTFGSNSYHLIDAPAGYGKTYLLKELEKRFNKKSWKCMVISVDINSTLQTLISALFSEFNPIISSDISSEESKEINQAADFDSTLEKPAEITKTAASFVSKFKEWSIEHCNSSDIQVKGLVIFIDLECPTPPNHLVEQLMKFVIEVGAILIKRSILTRNTFKSVITGRYLQSRKKQEDFDSSITFPETFQFLSLKLFEYQVVFEASSRFFAESQLTTTDEIKKTAAHILYLSGGHPGGMAKLLQIFDEQRDPDCLLISCRDKVEKEMTKVTEEVREGIPDDLLKIMDNLSPCRRFNTPLITHFMSDDHSIPATNTPILDKRNPIDFEDSLTTAHLVKREGGFLRNSITRRLLAKQLKDRDPNTFFHICQTAFDFYDADLKSDPDRADGVAIEWLYQKLQLLSQERNIDKLEDRQQMVKDFFDNHVKICLSTLIEGRNSIDKVQNLIDKLNKDEEFQFTLNYFLRTEEFNQNPYTKLKEEIQNFRNTLNTKGK